MSTSDSCKDGASKSSYDDVCEVGNMLQNMNTDNKGDADISVCANCGKDGSNLKSCTACKLVKYCNRECQIAHRPKHKKECRRRAAELHDEELFKQPLPEYGDCPICFIQVPTLDSGRRYMTCCGKMICSGCVHAPVYDNQGNQVDNKKCPFCRTPHPTSDEESCERVMERYKANDAEAVYNHGCDYKFRNFGFAQDYKKALELLHQAGELGHTKAYTNIGYAYQFGEGVGADKKKAVHYYELAAIGGCAQARHNLGIDDDNAGRMSRALKHYMIATRSGYAISLMCIKELYTLGHATKDDYTKALQLYQEYLGEIKSAQRDEAAAYDDQFRYY